MRKRAIFLVCVLAFPLLFGCSPKEGAKGEAPDDLDTPARTVEYLFGAIRGDAGLDTASLFSSAIPADLASGYVGKFRSEKEVTMYNIAGIEESEETAEVAVKYFYYGKKIEKDDVKLSSKELAEQRLTLNLEDGKWLIRFTGEDFDDEVEERVFYDCLNAVMDATIAQELYFGSAGAYTPVLAELQDVHPFKTDRCEELKIESADEYDFRLTATTANLARCRIIATSEAVIPTKYSECQTRDAAE